jgi:hypothetical protein
MNMLILLGVTLVLEPYKITWDYKLLVTLKEKIINPFNNKPTLKKTKIMALLGKKKQ